MSGEMRRTRSTKSVTVLAPCTVAVGLFGLLKKMRPAPRAVAIMPSRSSRHAESTLISVTGNFMLARVARAVLERRRARSRAPRYGETNARIALFRISCEPAPSTMFSGLVLCFVGDRVDEVAVVRRAVERIAARLGELAEDRVERGLARPERILVAVDLDLFDARRQLRPVPRPPPRPPWPPARPAPCCPAPCPAPPASGLLLASARAPLRGRGPPTRHQTPRRGLRPSPRTRGVKPTWDPPLQDQSRALKRYRLDSTLRPSILAIDNRVIGDLAIAGHRESAIANEHRAISTHSGRFSKPRCRQSLNRSPFDCPIPMPLSMRYCFLT